MDEVEEEDMDIKGNEDKVGDDGSEASKKKYALQLFSKPKDEEKKKLISKDPKARQIAIECGMNTAKVFLISFFIFKFSIFKFFIFKFKIF